MSWWDVLWLSLLEGLTEFLPISSTGHLILASAALGIHEDPFVQSFNIVIQGGAILSVLTLYRKKFFPFRWDFYSRVAVAFLPAAVLGLLFKKQVTAFLGSVEIVAWALILGGFVLIACDRVFSKQALEGKTVTDLPLWACGFLGVLQCLAFIPGVSRAGATILAGLAMGLNRKEATEFSFFLAVPTLAGASLIKSKDALAAISMDHLGMLLAGIVLSYVFAMLAIRFFVELVSRYGFLHFGIYRILLGASVLIFAI